MLSTPHMQQLAKQTRYHKIILICKTIASVNNNSSSATLPILQVQFEIHVQVYCSYQVPGSRFQVSRYSRHPTIKSSDATSRMRNKHFSVSDNTIKCHDMPHALWDPDSDPDPHGGGTVKPGYECQAMPLSLLLLLLRLLLIIICLFPVFVFNLSKTMATVKLQLSVLSR